MFKTKFITTTIIFISLLVITSALKNKTRVLEKKISNLSTKILLKKKDINETQLDFFYLSSPSEIEKKLNMIGFEKYQPIEFSKIFFDISDFNKIQSKISTLKSINEKKIQKK